MMQQRDQQVQQLQQENVGLKAEVYDATRSANNANQTLSSFAQGLAEKLKLDVESETLLDDIFNAVPEVKDTDKEVSDD